MADPRLSCYRYLYLIAVILGCVALGIYVLTR